MMYLQANSKHTHKHSLSHTHTMTTVIALIHEDIYLEKYFRCFISFIAFWCWCCCCFLFLLWFIFVAAMWTMSFTHCEPSYVCVCVFVFLFLYMACVYTTHIYFIWFFDIYFIYLLPSTGICSSSFSAMNCHIGKKYKTKTGN